MEGDGAGLMGKARNVCRPASREQREAELKEQAKRDAAAAREDAKPSALDRAVQFATRSAASSVGRQVANEIGRAVFGGSSRRSSSGGLAGQLVRGILGSLFK